MLCSSTLMCPFPNTNLSISLSLSLSLSRTHTVPLPTVTAPQPLIILLGEEATFTCSAYPVDTISWTVVDNSGMAVPLPDPVMDGNSSSISVTVSSIGQYQVTCTATNARGSVNGTSTLNAISECKCTVAPVFSTESQFLVHMYSYMCRWGRGVPHVIGGGKVIQSVLRSL